MGKPKNQTVVVSQPGEIVAVEKQKMLPTTPAVAPVSPMELLQQATSNGVDVAVIEKLMDLQERWEKNQARKAFNDDMAAFQTACPVIKKNKGVPLKSGQVAYKYAPIDSIVSQTKELIAKHGFRYSTSMELLEGGVRVICRVMHKLGHVEETPMHVPLGTKTDIMSNTQQIAAAQTFAKRYAFCNAFGIMTGDSDNDAALDKPTDKPQEDGKQDPAVIKKFIETATLKQLEGVMKKIKDSDKYTAAQKKEITALVDARMKALPDGYPVN